MVSLCAFVALHVGNDGGCNRNIKILAKCFNIQKSKPQYY